MCACAGLPFSYSCCRQTAKQAALLFSCLCCSGFLPPLQLLPEDGPARTGRRRSRFPDQLSSSRLKRGAPPSSSPRNGVAQEPNQAQLEDRRLSPALVSRDFRLPASARASMGL